MDKFLKNIFSVLSIFLIIAAILILLQPKEKSPEEITLGVLAGNINEEKVQKITIDGENLAIELKDKTLQKSVKETESSLTETLINLGANEKKLQSVEIKVTGVSSFSFWAGSVLPFLLPILLIGFFIWFMFRQAQRGNSQALSFGLSRARIIDPKDKRKRISFKDVAGETEAKEELMEVVEFLKDPKKFLVMGAKIPKGVLLMGPPGTGKTLMAKAVAGEAGVPFFNISGSEFVEMFVGVGASRVRDLFKQAKKQAPSIVFIDEIDAVGRHRGAGLGGGHDEREQTLNQILVEMDGFETETNVIVLASTNRPDVLDPALLRPGRFDRRVTLELPDITEREQILAIHAKNKPISKKAVMRIIAQRTPGFSGADLANLLNEASILAARREKKVVSMKELTEAIEKVILGPERKSRIINPEEKKIIAYHEAGHALVGASLPHADPVQKVSIISRGHAGGYTLSVPTEDRHLRSRAYYIDELSVLLGGYVSETLTFEDITTGPSNDLERATHLARGMVTRYGMSPLGPRTFGKKEELVFLGREISEERDYSNETAEAIDKEVSALLNNAFLTAKRILTKKKDILEKIAQALLEKETLEKEEFDTLVLARTPTEKDTSAIQKTEDSSEIPSPFSI